MQTEKRFLLALGLTMAFLYLWFEYFAPKPSPRPTPSKEQQEESQPRKGVQAKEESSLGVKEQRKKEEDRPEVSTVPPVSIREESEFLSMVWTNRGATPKEVLLKKYRETQKQDSALIKVIPFESPSSSPLLWEFDVNGHVFSDADAVYSVTRANEQEIHFSHQFDQALFVEKTYRWSENSYLIEHEVQVRNLYSQPIKLLAKTALFSAQKPKKGGSFFAFAGGFKQPVRAVAYINEQTVRKTFEDIKKEKEIPTGPIQWAGFDGQYFLLSALPKEGLWKQMKLKASDENQMTLNLSYPSWNISPSGTQKYSLFLYAGPKDIGVLRTAGSSLDRAIDLGDWIGPIARPILWFLRWLYELIPNYGIAIVLLTVLIRLLMFPLTQMQARSMKKMQQHKPQMDALKEKYGENKEAYSRELMNYMRTHRINPMGGCLLLLPQMPVFFALYRVLYNSIELRHAPFVLWIQDLSEKDPYFVMPVLVGVTMFFQQKLTPTPTADSAQQTMMKIMPVMFSVFMLFLPAGLNLYIFVSTLWGVVQQYWVQRDLAPAIAPKEKVRKKQ